MKHEHNRRKKARAHLAKAGYGKMGGHFKDGGHVKHSDEAEDEALIKKEVKPSALKKKLADGGCADGGKPKHRADRLKRGGRAKAHGKKGAHTQVNVIVGHGGQKPPMVVPKPVPVPVPPGGPAGPMAGPPGGPPMPPPDQSGGMGGPGPMGLKKGGRAKRSMGGNDREKMPGMPPGHFKKGGRTGYPIKDGAGGGEGRLEKAKAYGA